MSFAVTTFAHGGTAGTTVGSVSTGAFSAVAGNLIVVAVSIFNVGALPVGGSITDTAGNTYTLIGSSPASPTVSDGKPNIWFFYSNNILGNASNIVTCNPPGSSNYSEIVAWQISGAQSGNPVNITAIGGSTTGAETTAALTTTLSNTIVLAYGTADNLGTTFTAAAGYTLDLGSADDTLSGCEHQAFTSIQTAIVPAITASNTSVLWQMMAVAIAGASQPGNGNLLVAQAPIVLSTGAIARYPLSVKSSFATRTNEFADFSRQTFAQLATPLSEWVLNLSLLQDSEANDYREFFELMQGSATPFVFIDPSDNLFTNSEELEMHSSGPWVWEGASTTVAIVNTADPFAVQSNRVRQANLLSSQSGAVYQEVLVAPGGTGESRTKGITFTVSGYLQKPASGGISSVNIFIEGTDQSEYTQTVCTLGSGWQRFSVTHQFALTNPVAGIAAGIIAASGSGLVNIFGMQLECNGVASPYKRRQAYSGFHPKCYFKTDEFSKLVSEYNINAIQQLTIQESN